MTPTQQLTQEHEAIKLMLQILYKISEKLEKKGAVNPKDLEKIIEFITVFADKCHHAKEEDFLFPALEQSGIPKEDGPIAVMLMEHDQGRGFVKMMKEAAKNYKIGNQSSNDVIIENARNYITLLTEHIDKENNILYPIADMHITKEKQDQLLTEFDRVEQERVGKGKHEEFHRLLDDLSKIYLN